ncbi:MAG TPA: aminoglycoside phosphotransferase family protein [Candidatus Dojkabacteria bacterium]|jgi:hypothetical protein
MNFNISKNTIREVLKKEFGIENVQLSETKLGFVAMGFKVESRERKYFFKIWKKGRYDENVLESIKIYKKLQKLEFVPELLRSFHNSKFIFALFEFLEGEWTYDYDNKKLAEYLSRLHSIGNLSNGSPMEEFEIIYEKELWEILENIFRNNPKDYYEKFVRDFLEAYEIEIRKHWEYFIKLRDELKSLGSETFVMTHGDLFGNVMDKDGKLYIFDWDAILLSFSERDLWFKFNDGEFMKNYKKFNLNYSENIKAYEYYLLNRYFYDLYGFLVEILNPNNNGEKRKENILLLEKDWKGWLYKEVKNL